MRRRLCGVAVAAAAAATAAPHPSPAQPAPAPAERSASATATRTPPKPARWLDLAERRFDRRDGLRSDEVFDVLVVGDSTLWVATEHGPLVFDGRRFAPLPWPLRGEPTARQLLETADGAVWVATRRGVIRYGADLQPELFGTDAGLGPGTIYRIIETDVRDGRRELLATTDTAVFAFDGRRFAPLPLPDALDRGGLTITARRAPSGAGELWVASASGGSARLRDGEWRVFDARDGLAALGVELLLADTASQARTLYAATEAGVFRFVDETERWEPLLASPRYAYRLTIAPGRGGTRELWVGTHDGVLVRSRGAMWDTIPIRSATPRAPILALATVAGHAGRAAVYVGTQGDGLLRLAVGRASTLIADALPVRVRVRDLVVDPDDADAVLIGSHNFGLLAYGGERLRAQLPREAIPGGRITHFAVRRLARGGRELWFTAPGGAWRRTASGFIPVRDGLPLAEATTIAAGPLDPGRLDPGRLDASPAGGVDDGLLLGMAGRVFRFDGTRWFDDGLPASRDVSALLPPDSSGSPWLAATAVGAFARREGVWYALPLTGIATPVGAPLRAMRALVRYTDPAGRRWLVAGTTNGVFVRDAADDQAPWRVVASREVEDGYRWSVTALAVHDAETLVVGTMARGLVAIRATDADPETWRVAVRVDVPEGLPAHAVTAIGPATSSGERWVGTALGVARVDITEVADPRLPTLRLALREGTADSLVASDMRVPHDHALLTVGAALATFHREDETRYRFDLDGPVRVSSSEWQSAPEYQFARLPGGRYTVAVRARDYAGREVGPVMLSFDVAFAPWRSPLAVSAYALLALGAAGAGVRRRTRTLRRRAEASEARARAARARERTFRALFEQAFDGHLLVEQGHVAAANARAAELCGAPAAALPGRRVVDLLPSLDPTALAGDDRTAESEVRRTDGTTVPVAVTATRLPELEPPVVHVILRDLTADRAAAARQQALESRVQEAQKFESLGTLAGGVAHDFNNLLGIIRGNVELAQLAGDDRRAVADHLAAVLGASDRARDLVRQILTFSRRTEALRRPVDVATVVREMAGMLRAMVPTTVALTVDLPAPPARAAVRGDPSQLQQLLLNLVANAEYALRGVPKAALTVRVRLAPGPDGPLAGRSCVELAVVDTGVGMPADVAARALEPFFTTKPIGEGTGLGLAVLHGIVSAHGGDVRIETRPGEGTSVRVWLPFDAGAVETPPAQPITQPITQPTAQRITQPTAGSGLASVDEPSRVASGMTDEADHVGIAAAAPAGRIIVVDDEPAVARVLERALGRWGYDVRMFADAVAARRYLIDENELAALLITDQTMPSLTGTGLARDLAQRRPEVRVIVVSGFPSRIEADGPLPASVVAVLEKPLALETLRAAVVTAVGEAAGQGGGARRAATPPPMPSHPG